MYHHYMQSHINPFVIDIKTSSNDKIRAIQLKLRILDRKSQLTHCLTEISVTWINACEVRCVACIHGFELVL